ncbi:MAG: FAD-dependent monooxygenase, partial [Acidimicrobiaceae bacterium]|nr:FAD-dependent monooxygenase [Acidimicrobiaceae bacterium]
AWKLDLVLAGEAPAGLLDTYGSERAPQVQAELDFSVVLGRFLCVVDPDEAAARDEALRALGAAGPQPLPDRPPPGPGCWHDGDPHAGAVGLQAVVVAGGRRLLLDDLTGGGWALLGTSGDTTGLPAELARWWVSIGGGSHSIGPGGTLGDPDGAYRRWFDSLGADSVIVRPDGYLYGAAAGPSGGADLAAALRRHLRAL